MLTRNKRAAAWLGALAIPLLLSAAAAFLSKLDIVHAREEQSIGFRFKVRGVLVPSPEIVLIVLDEETLRDLALHYPFPPLKYAELIWKLESAGAAAIAFDLLYSEPTRECDPPHQDALLARTIQRGGNVVWAIELENGERPHPPIPVIRDAVATTGFINFPDEVEWGIRRAQLQKGVSSSFAAAIVTTYAGFLPPALQGPGLRRINYRGGPGTYPSIGMSRILRGDFDRARVNGKICIFGATYAASHDLYQTPFHHADSGDMPGVEIHANIVGNILRNDFLRDGPAGPYWFAAILISIAISGLLFFGRPWFSLALFLAAACGWLAWSIHRFLQGEVVLLVTPIALFTATFATTTFLTYLLERNRRREIRALFASYVDPSAIKWLEQHPDSFNPAGQLRIVTVLDTDIEGFTTITQQIGPEALVALLNEYFEVVSTAATSAGGMLDKFVGDALMVIYGFPIEQSDHALRAVGAAREILRCVERMNEDFRKRGLPPLHTRIGICSGEVVAGAVGGRTKRTITVMGDAANMASRLEALNKRFGTRVLISESTARLLPSDIPLRDLGEVEVRGIARPERVFNPVFDQRPTGPQTGK